MSDRLPSRLYAGDTFRALDGNGFEQGEWVVLRNFETAKMYDLARGELDDPDIHSFLRLLRDRKYIERMGHMKEWLISTWDFV